MSDPTKLCGFTFGFMTSLRRYYNQSISKGLMRKKKNSHTDLCCGSGG